MNNPYDDNTKVKALDVAKNYAHEYERQSDHASFVNILDKNVDDPFMRWEHTAMTLAGMYIATAVHDSAWEDNTKKIDAWHQFDTAFDTFKKRVAESTLEQDYLNLYKRHFNERISNFIKHQKTASQTVRNALKNPKVKPEQVAI